MPTDLNPVDLERLQKLQAFYRTYRYIPSVRRVAEITGMASKSWAHRFLLELQASGYIERPHDDAPWMPARRWYERKLLDAPVHAGLSEVVADSVADPFYLDEYLIEKPESTVIVPVRGDSMIDAGIHEGDLAVVEKYREPKTGDLVVALIDGQMTLKELIRDQDRYALKAHNAKYDLIRPAATLQIYGIVVGIIRRY